MSDQPAYTDADVELATRTWWQGNGHDWDEHIEGEDKPYLLSEFRAVLDAVAPAIAARALREAASAIDSSDPEGDEWSTNDLRARADEIEAGR